MSITKYYQMQSEKTYDNWCDRPRDLYFEEDAIAATVYTRLDVANNLLVNVYNGKTLEKINKGIWALVAISALDLFIKF